MEDRYRYIKYADVSLCCWTKEERLLSWKGKHIQNRIQYTPQRRSKLCPSIRNDLGWNTKTRDPTRVEGQSRILSRGQGQRNGLQPTRGSVYNHEVNKTLELGRDLTRSR